MIDRLVALPTVVSLCVLVCGCQPPVAIDKATRFEPNYVFAEVIKIRADVETESPAKAIDDQLIEWFGTPDDPKLPPAFEADESLKSLISLDNLKMAAGPAPLTAEPGETGLFRQQCATCHGETGQGRGVVAASQNPYPRDFRRGVYKYKTTGRASKPTKADLRRTLVEGLDGTQMPRFDKLSAKQIDAIIDYIIYLSIRGETERQLLNLAPDYDGEPYLAKSKITKEGDQPAKTETAEGEQAEAPEPYTEEDYNDQLDEATTTLTDVATSWVDAEDGIEEPAEPEQTVVPGITEGDVAADQLAASITRGKALFSNQTSSCAKCHGETGNGIGQQIPDFDDWTKEWTTGIQIDPRNRDDLLPFLVKGAMIPQPLMPRNLVEGRLRGGRNPAAIYHRILHGIAGSPMPAATLKASPEALGLTTDDIWDIVNYVVSLQAQPTTPPPAQAVPAS
jgi:mono/diheme cytochrome c family protein